MSHMQGETQLACLALLKCLLIIPFPSDFFFPSWLSLALLLEAGCKFGSLVLPVQTQEAFR